MSHSFHGNELSCANWSSFWLNEGFTTFTERKIAYAQRGKAGRDFEYIVGRLALNSALESMKDTPRYQRLHIPYEFGQRTFFGRARSAGSRACLSQERIRTMASRL